MIVIPGMPPGIRLGLSNLVTMYCVFSWGRQRLHDGSVKIAVRSADARRSRRNVEPVRRIAVGDRHLLADFCPKTACTTFR